MPHDAEAASPPGGLGRGWVVVPRGVVGRRDGEPVRIDVVLLHAARGIALLEAPPHWTADAPALLRRRLDDAFFGAVFPGNLPVVHAALRSGELAALPRFLSEAFAAQPPLSLAGGDAWVRAARRLLQDAVPPRQEPLPVIPAGERRLGLVAGVAGLVLAAALGGGAMLLHTPTPAREAIAAQRPVEATPPAVADAPEQPSMLTLLRLNHHAAGADAMPPADKSEMATVLSDRHAEEARTGDAETGAEPKQQPSLAAGAAPSPDISALPRPQPTAPPPEHPEPPSLAEPGVAPAMAPALAAGQDAIALEATSPPAAVAGPIEVPSAPPEEPPGPAETSTVPAPPIHALTQATETVAPSSLQDEGAAPAQPAGTGATPTLPDATAAARPPALPVEPAAPAPLERGAGDPAGAPFPPTEAVAAIPAAPAAGAAPPPITPSGAVAAVPRPADSALVTALIRRGDSLLALGDVSGARRFYERAAEAGSAAGARAAGRTHDPEVLAGLGARGIRPDPEAAAAWYARAEALAITEGR